MVQSLKSTRKRFAANRNKWQAYCVTSRVCSTRQILPFAIPAKCTQCKMEQRKWMKSIFGERIFLLSERFSLFTDTFCVCMPCRVPYERQSTSSTDLARMSFNRPIFRLWFDFSDNGYAHFITSIQRRECVVYSLHSNQFNWFDFFGPQSNEWFGRQSTIFTLAHQFIQ